MSKAQKQKLLALSVAGLVASSVAAIAGVTTFENGLTGKATYVSYEDGHMGGTYGGYSGGSAYSTSGGSPSTSTAGASTTTSTSGPVGLNCAGGTLAACQATCTKDGVVNNFCKGYCSQECPSTSTTTGTSTATVVTDRCAHATGNCAERVRCLIELGACGSPKTGEKQMCDDIKIAATARGVKNAAINMETGMAYCDELKAAPPPAPVVETPAPVILPTVEAPPAVPAVSVEDPELAEWEEEDQPSLRGLRPASDDDFGGGDYDDFDDFGDDFGGEFHGGPGDFGGFDGDFDMGFGGHDEEFMRAMMDQYGGEFSLGEDDFSGYFGDVSPGMGGGEFGFGGDFGGGFGGDEFGGMPEWMGNELEDMKDMMRDMAEGMCPELVEEIDDIEDFEGMEELGFRMQEECMGGGGMGGGPMEDPSEIVETLRAMTEGIDGGLGVLEENGLDKSIASDIRGLLTQVSAAADEAEEACADLGFGEEEDEDLFGFKGLLAQVFDDEDEEDEDEDFDDEDEDGEGGACREAIEKAFSLMDPDSDEEYPNSVRGIMQPAIEDFFRELHEEDEAKSRKVFAAFMKEMAPVVVGDKMELSDEDIDGMYDMLVASDFNFDMVASPSTDHGEWEADDIGRNFGDDFGEFDEEEEEEFESEGGKAGGGGDEEEFSDEDFDF